jgi:hypothetical protein
VCLERDLAQTCLRNYNFLSVFNTKDLSGLQSDGILGLAPSNQGTGAELFIERLYRENMIAKKVFAFNLGGTNEKSNVIFGDYDVGKYAKPGSQISWNTLKDDTYWTI